jgi:DNA (cytosine-5)-methyltransferase 1
VTKKLTAVDLFCGAGGLSEGLRQAGYRVAGAVELDPLACKTYRLNHRSTKLWKKDIGQLTGPAMMRALKLRPGQLDLLAACPPCQGFSSMRTKNGNTWNRDSRNDLIFDVLRLITTMKPKTVMLENVPGLANSGRYRIFRKGLKRLGYAINWDVLNTVNYGVPQSRRRLILLAAKSVKPDFAAETHLRKTVRQFIGDLNIPSRSRDPLHNYSTARSEKVERLIRKIPRDGGSRLSLGRRAQLPCHKRLDGFKDVYGRMYWDKPSPTITSGCINPSKGRFLHPHQHRPITLREAALLQTFPKSYRFALDRGRFSVALMIGNALPPEFIKRHAMALKQSVLTAA